MPEMKNNFQGGKMNKDLDERLVPSGEYRDALNVEIATTSSSDLGTLRTLKGNLLLGGSWQGTNGVPESGTCVGSISDDKNDKLYFMIAGEDTDFIIEYDYGTQLFFPVCVDNHTANAHRALNFNKDFLITGVNIIEDLLFWTDNNSEPKRINITRGKAFGATLSAANYYTTHTSLMVKDVSTGAAPNTFVNSGKLIEEEHLTVIRKGPPAAPVLEMLDTLSTDDWDGDGDLGGVELRREVASLSGSWLDVNTGDFVSTLVISMSPDPDGDTGYQAGTDFSAGDILNVYQFDDRTVKVRVKVISGGSIGYTCEILSGNKDITSADKLIAELEQRDALFQFKFPRFACRYKYEDGEYSAFSPFTEPAFLPGPFNYVPKEGYNLGMLNNLRKLAIKDFVHDRQIPDDVTAIDILYKESNSTNIYSVKTIKKREYNSSVWNEWNALSSDTSWNPALNNFNNTKARVMGYMPITTEMIHAVLPANQLLRPWDNVPRKALAQEVIGNRLVYGNYLQNYNLQNSINSNIKVDLQAGVLSTSVGDVAPEEIHAGLKRHLDYYPAKSLKSLRTYQVGVVYLDQYGRETPVFSEDKRGANYGATTSEASVYIDKDRAPKRNALQVTMKNNPPSWATHMKFFVKETSNEYYNLSMDRWYDAEDGNIWLSFPSADRNKVDEETFIILKKEHDNNTPIDDPARYKIIAIENEAPRFIKLQNISMGAVVDGNFDADGFGGAHFQLGPNSNGFPGEQGSGLHSFQVNVHKDAFELAGWKESLINQDISQCFFRITSAGTGTSNYYRVKQVTWDGGDGTYAIKSGKQFGGDMAFTSVDGTYLNRNPNCELQIMKKIPEDRAEFEGRFFVKVLKDHTLIERLGISSTVQDNLVVTASMKVQYINPTGIQAPGGWDGYGTSAKKISIDSKTGSHSFRPPGYSSGHGDKFWKMAGDDENTNSTSASSGWFIDKVEAFRPFKGQVRQFVSNKDNNVKFTNETSCHGTFSDCLFSSSYNNPLPRLLQAIGLDTYNHGNSTNYLGMGIKGPGRSSDFMRPKHNVSRSLGIDTSINLVHLSYAGLNTGTGGGAYSGAGDGYSNDDWDFKQGNKHAEDLSFIDKIKAPGTLWRWREDPDKVLYRTVVGTAVNQNSEYTAAYMGREKLDRDGNAGVFVYNYASFNDYFIKEHHQHTGCGCFGCGAYSWTHGFVDFASRGIGNTNFGSCSGQEIPDLLRVSFNATAAGHWHSGASDWETGGPFYVGGYWDSHKKFPMGIWNWKNCYNRRRRFAIFVEVVEDPTAQIGSYGPHKYLPTNDPNLPPHFDHHANPITTFPAGHAMEGGPILTPAPGIRPDGMYSGHNDHPNGPYLFDKGDGNGAVNIDQIPQYKRWDANYTTNGAAPRESGVPGSVTFEVVEHFEEDSEKFTSTNPAIWETEPKEDVGLDIYHEVGQIYPIELNDKTIEQFVGPVHVDITRNSYVQCWDPPYAPGSGAGTISLMAGGIRDVRVLAAKDNYVRLGVDTSTASELALDSNNALHTTPTVGSYLMFHRADGSRTEAHVGPNTYNVAGSGTWYELVGISGETGVHNKQIVLPWFNCYSFGNGVESDRIRDDFNQVTIDNGPKASTTLEEPYLEERRSNGFIWSGLYNSTSGVNDLNQFIQAEAITKDTNPSYGSIQKLHARDSDLVAFCEDRVLKVLANKDALFNANGNTNLVSTNRVLGNIKPFSGDYGISLNPESFASDSHRAYFADSSRGAVLRLSQDGITAISSVGMHAFFAGTLARTGDYNIIGSFDDNKAEYNMTLESITYEPSYLLPLGVTQTSPCGGGTVVSTGVGSTTVEERASYNTLSYSEKSKGWVSFKSWNHENGISLNNSYYTFKNGNMYRHHVNETHNNFYGNQFDSYVDVLFNKAPGVIKSYSTFNYEGSQARITPGVNNSPDYYDDLPKTGWYIGSAVSNAQELGELEFWDKEDKWFSQIKGVTTEWLNDGTAGNIDPREFSFQGIGDSISVTCPDCPPTTSWNCVGSPCECEQVSGSQGTYPTEMACKNDINSCCGSNETWCCTDNGCIDPGDGSGGFATLCDCVANCCEDGYTYLYNCMGVQPVPVAPYVYGCMDDGITTDPFITQDRPSGWVGSATTYSSQANVPNCDCEYRSSIATYDCHHGNCVGAIGGTGMYATYQDCLDNCISVRGENTYDCVNGNCVGNAYGTGQYATYQDCNDNCGIYKPPTYDCVNGNCVGSAWGTGQYTTYQDCLDNCVDDSNEYTSSYSCSTYSGVYTGFPQQYIQPYTCYENLNQSTNQPVPYGTPGAGIYPTMLDCINDTNNSCSNVNVGEDPCENQNMMLESIVVEPTPSGPSNNPCESTLSDGSVQVMVTNQFSTATTPFTSWTYELYDAIISPTSAPSIGNLIYSDPTVYSVGAYSNAYVGLTTTQAGTTAYGIYYVVITDENGCEYGPFTITVNCVQEQCVGFGTDPGWDWSCCGKCGPGNTGSIPGSPCYDFCQEWWSENSWENCCEDYDEGPCDDYPGDLVYDAAGQTCCGKCDQWIAGDPLHPCHNFCVEWGDCCDGDDDGDDNGVVSYDCLQGNCVGSADGTGQYSTYQDCVDNCVGVDCEPNCNLALAIPYGLGIGTYAPGAMVEYNGSFYLMSSSGLNGTPGDPLNGWELCCSFVGTYPGNDAYECDFPLGTNLSAYTPMISGIGFGDEFCCDWEAVVFQQVNPSCPGSYDGVVEAFLPYGPQFGTTAFSVLANLAFQQGTLTPSPYIVWYNTNGDPIGNGASTTYPSSSDTLTGMPAGTYTAEVWNCDSGDVQQGTQWNAPYYGCSQPGCSYTVTVTLVDPDPMSVVGTVTDATPNVSTGVGNSDGSISLSVSGGVAPYTYAWSNGASTQTASGLSLGPYNVTVTDAGGCTATGAWFVLVN